MKPITITIMGEAVENMRTKTRSRAVQFTKVRSAIAAIYGRESKFRVQYHKYELYGVRSGMLVAQRTRRINGQVRWECVCDCGNVVFVNGAHFRNGSSKSCGCTRKRNFNSITHGQTRGGPTPTYNSWRGMIDRCTNPNNSDYKYYGSQGVLVCPRWRDSFEAFREDMGDRPEGLTLDRIDPNGNYCPENCRWTTISEQNKNKRNKAG